MTFEVEQEDLRGKPVLRVNRALLDDTLTQGKAKALDTLRVAKVERMPGSVRGFNLRDERGGSSGFGGQTP